MDKNNCGKPQFSGERVNVALGELCEILNGYAFKSKQYVGEGIRVIRIANVQKGYLEDSHPCFYPASEKGSIAQFLLYENDLLLSLTGNVGRVALLDKRFLPAALNQRVACLRIKDESRLSKRYLFHCLNSTCFENKCVESANGIAQKNLSTVWLKGYKISVPQLDKQLEIARRFDLIQGQIDYAKAHLVKLDALVKSRFNEMFGDYESWLRSSDKKRLDELCWIGSSKRVHKNDYVSDGIPFFRSKEIVELSKGERPTTELYIERDRFERITEKNGAPAAGDLLVTAVGTIGVIWIVDGCSPFYFKDGNLLWLKPNNMEPTFLKYLLSELLSKNVDRLTGGSAYKALTIDRISQMMVVVPSPALQSEFAFFAHQVDKLRFMLLANPSPAFGCRSFCCSTNSGNGGVILDA